MDVGATKSIKYGWDKMYENKTKKRKDDKPNEIKPNETSVHLRQQKCM